MFLAVVAMLLFCQIAGAGENANWPDWRGPGGQGHSEAADLPLNWSESKNIVWKTPIHDLGYSSPVVWDDQVWLTTAREDGTVLYAVAVDGNTGKVIHDIEETFKDSLSIIKIFIPFIESKIFFEKEEICKAFIGLIQRIKDTVQNFFTKRKENSL